MTLRIVQITDCHLQPDNKTLYKAIDADAHLEQCLQWVKENGDFDLLVLSGDLSNHGSHSAYVRLNTKISQLKVPCVWMLGNHDDANLMQQVCSQDVANLRVLDYSHWQLIMLNTTEHADGQGGGSLSNDQMNALEEVLKGPSEKPLCVFMHHNALPVNSMWQDEIMLGNASEFNALIAKYPQVKLVVCGHVHQEFDRFSGAVRYMATPSSAVQFVCEQDEYKVESELGPSFRLLTLLNDGQIMTEVKRLPKL